MTTAVASASPMFPRFFRVAGVWINSYKILLIIGIYVGSLTAAALAQAAGGSPLRVGLGAMTCALCGLIGARLYYVLVHASRYLTRGSRHRLWDVDRGGWSVFGALLTFIPAAWAISWFVGLPLRELFDQMSGGVLTGGFWIRLGCVFNGCCVGRETRSSFGVRLHDVRGIRKVRLPVQFFEMAWWLLGSVVFLSFWSIPAPPGSFALAVLLWYGVARVALEPMREAPNVVFGTVRIDQLVAAGLAIIAGLALVALNRP